MIDDEPRREHYCHWVYDVNGKLVMRSQYRNIPESVIAELEAQSPLPVNWLELAREKFDAETEAILAAHPELRKNKQ